MRTQTKCTLAVCGLLVIELLPIPFSSLYSLYVVRRRPNWLPDTVERLYAEEPVKDDKPWVRWVPYGHDPMQTRKNCTLWLTVVFMVDLLVPVVIPTSLYVVRRKPMWFKQLVAKLYADRLSFSVMKSVIAIAPSEPTPEDLKALDQKFNELEKTNREFAKTISRKHGRAGSARLH